MFNRFAQLIALQLEIEFAREEAQTAPIDRRVDQGRRHAIHGALTLLELAQLP
jgi:hypothetical protein